MADTPGMDRHSRIRANSRPGFTTEPRGRPCSRRRFQFDRDRHELRHDDSRRLGALTPALGQPIGVEFDDTTYENSVALNASSGGHEPHLVQATQGSWGGVDNVILQIAGVANGDLNGDGVVDILDYRVIRDHLQSNSSYLANGDMNGDGKVDLNDFRAWTKIAGPLPGAGQLRQRQSCPSRRRASWPCARSALRMLGMIWASAVAGRFAVCDVWRSCALAVGTTLFTAVRAHAVLLAYDPFNDTNGNYTDGIDRRPESDDRAGQSIVLPERVEPPRKRSGRRRPDCAADKSQLPGQGRGGRLDPQLRLSHWLRRWRTWRTSGSSMAPEPASPLGQHHERNLLHGL